MGTGFHLGEQIVFPFPLIAHKLRWQVSTHCGFIPKNLRSLEVSKARFGASWDGGRCPMDSLMDVISFPNNSFCYSPNSGLEGLEVKLPDGICHRDLEPILSPVPNSFSFPRAGQGFPAVPGGTSPVFPGHPGIIPQLSTAPAFPAPLSASLAPPLLPISWGNSFPQNLIFPP